jgi:thioredoxin-like negative regulator of GroEL
MSLDIQIKSVEEINSILENEKATIVYFTSPKCNVCKTLRPKIMEIMSEEFPEMGRYFVDIAETQDVPAQFTVFTAPTIIVFLDGREFSRKSRAMSPAQLVEEIRRPYDIMMS